MIVDIMTKPLTCCAGILAVVVFIGISHGPIAAFLVVGLAAVFFLVGSYLL